MIHRDPFPILRSKLTRCLECSAASKRLRGIQVQRQHVMFGLCRACRSPRYADATMCLRHLLIVRSNNRKYRPNTRAWQPGDAGRGPTETRAEGIAPIL